SAELIESGNTLAKKALLFEDEYDNKKYSFRLSGDFIEFNSHCEFMPSFQYEPNNNESYTGYLENYPKIFIGPENDVYDAIENNAPVVDEYEKLDNKYFAFKAELFYYGEILYCYGFREGTAREHEIFGLTYSQDIENTPLEKKLTSIFDEAIESYTES
ncbi:MAG: hypothetical protein K2H19_01685, partial [Ruminococcus sp.]|nr:hypothetical protein [Ruminococcus sp.]